MESQGSIDFGAGRQETPTGASPRDRIVARDGRAAAWMAAGWAAITGEPGSVVCSEAWDFEQAVTAASYCTVPVHCFGPDGLQAPVPRPASTIGRILGSPQTAAGRAIRPERLVAETLAAIPPGLTCAIVVEDERYAALVEALRGPSVTLAVKLIDRIAGSAHGSAVAVATGVKAADRSRIVVVITDPASFVAGAADLETAGRYGLAVATVVGTVPDGSPPPPYEQLAAIAGGHGECVEDAGRLPLHLRNAIAAPMPTVINAILDPASFGALAASLPSDA